MRTFIAINLPGDLREKILQLQSEIKKENILSGNWTSSYHITLKFLGEVNETKLEKIKNILKNICTKTKKFSLGLEGISVFPSETYARVIFAGIGEGNEQAMLLQRQIDAALKKEGFSLEKNYQNHVTLVRIKSVSDKEKLKKVLSRYAEQSFGKFIVDKIELTKSTLTPTGPVYETINEFPLA